MLCVVVVVFLHDASAVSGRFFHCLPSFRSRVYVRWDLCTLRGLSPPPNTFSPAFQMGISLRALWANPQDLLGCGAVSGRPGVGHASCNISRTLISSQDIHMIADCSLLFYFFRSPLAWTLTSKVSTVDLISTGGAGGCRRVLGWGDCTMRWQRAMKFY